MIEHPTLNFEPRICGRVGGLCAYWVSFYAFPVDEEKAVKIANNYFCNFK